MPFIFVNDEVGYVRMTDKRWEKAEGLCRQLVDGFARWLRRNPNCGYGGIRYCGWTADQDKTDPLFIDARLLNEKPGSIYQVTEQSLYDIAGPSVFRKAIPSLQDTICKQCGKTRREHIRSEDVLYPDALWCDERAEQSFVLQEACHA